MATDGRGYLPYIESRFYDKLGIFTKNEEDNTTEDFDPEEEACDERIQDLSSSEIKKLRKGTKLMEPSTPRTVKGTLYNPNGKKKWNIKARLHLDNPWWMVHILRTNTHNGYVVPTGQNAVSYRLITDEHLVKHHKLVEILLTDRILDNSAALDKFEQFVQLIHEELRLDVAHLLDLTQRFEDYLPDADKGIVSQITKRLTGFDGKMVHRAQEFPALFRYLPQLVPDHFLSIVNTDPDQLATLARLDSALKEEPWVFAFKRILVKEYSMIGIEVSQEVLRKCGILSKIPKLYQDAIEMYTYVKNVTNRQGHTCLRLSEEFHNNNLEVLNPEMNRGVALQYLYDKEILVRERILGKMWTFPYDLWKSEVNIAKGLNHLFQQHLYNPEILDINITKDNPNFANICNDTYQKKAAELIKNFPVVVVCGKGGCGKTTVVTKVMSETYKVSSSKETRDNPIVLYTAPTGKAAKLLGRKAGTDGFTLHQIIYSYRGYLKKNDPESTWKFSRAEVLIVDECSMVAVHTFATILEILQRNSNLKRVVFLGDYRQLPSVQPGNFLDDIFKTFDKKSCCSIELKINHRAESELIIKNATAISDRKMPRFDDKWNYKFHPVLSQNPKQKEYDNENFKKVLEHMLRSEENMKDHTTSHIIAFTRNMCKLINQLAMEFYNPDRVEGRPREINKFRIGDKIGLYKNGWVDLFKWEDAGKSGSVCPVFLEDNDDERIQPTQLPAGTETPSKRGTETPSKRGTETPSKRGTASGQKLCHNQEFAREMMQEHDQSNGSPPSHSINGSPPSQSNKKEKRQKMLRLCNGEIYFIKDDYEQDEEVKNGAHRRRRYLKLSDEDAESPTEFYVLYSQLMRECNMTQAWAKTIHTFQGSECDTITFVVGNCEKQNWTHVYTAVTRGRSAVNIIGQEAWLEKSVRKIQVHRKTGLSHQLQNILPPRLRDELWEVARNAGSPAKSKIKEVSRKDSICALDGIENSGTYTDISSVHSTPYFCGHSTPTKSRRTPSVNGYLSDQNGDSRRSRSGYYPDSSGSTSQHMFKGQGSEKFAHFATSHNPSIQSPAKSRLFKETPSNATTPSACQCHDIKACICGVTPISLESTKRRVDDAKGAGEEWSDSQWSDVSNTDDLFTCEDQVLQNTRQDSDGDSDETVDMSGDHFDLSDEEFVTDIKPQPERSGTSSTSRLFVPASLSSLAVPLRVGRTLMNPSPKRPAEAEYSLDYVTPAKQMCHTASHTGMTPALKKLKF